MPNAPWMTVKMMIDREQVVVQAELLGDVVQRVDQRFLRKQVGDQEEDQEPDPAFDPADAQRVRVENAQQHAEDGDAKLEMKLFQSFAAEVDPVPEVDDALQVEVRAAARAGRGWRSRSGS